MTDLAAAVHFMHCSMLVLQLRDFAPTMMSEYGR